MYFFPTAYPQQPFCSWISHSFVYDLQRTPQNRTKIIFRNGKTIVLDVSYGSMLNQLQRTAQFRYLLEERINLPKNRKPKESKEDDEDEFFLFT
ncbi:competence protein ComK [Paraliobacillus ryukyuensis]|uniref:competence protein ComK n=1 Tax=Paraliobacillus ryukyuensis TaxID=200904 RepID=UPI000DE8CE23